MPLLNYRLGPLTTSWCMRMEAKNSYLKNITRQGNFKNIALSVARRHQKLMCAILNDADFFGKMIIKPQSMYAYVRGMGKGTHRQFLVFSVNTSKLCFLHNILLRS